MELASFNPSRQLQTILNYENKKDDNETQITQVDLKQVSSNLKENKILMSLSYICGYKGKSYHCLSNNIV